MSSIHIRFHSDAKLPLVTWRPLANQIVPSWSFGQSWSCFVFVPFLFSRVSSGNFPVKGFQILPIEIFSVFALRLSSEDVIPGAGRSLALLALTSIQDRPSRPQGQSWIYISMACALWSLSAAKGLYFSTHVKFKAGLGHWKYGSDYWT